MFKKMILASILAAMTTLAFGAQSDLIVPAAIAGPGAFGSEWQSELTLHNAGAQAIDINLVFHHENGTIYRSAVTLEPRSTRVFSDVVTTRFGLADARGAIVIQGSDLAMTKLVVTSRIVNHSAAGQFGQDIPAIPAANGFGKGDTAVLTGPGEAAASRFNFGLFATEETSIQWKLLRSDGTVAGEADRSYTAGAQVQYNNGVQALFGAAPADGDVVHAVIGAGKAFLYGSVVNQQTGDPSFVPAIRTRENLAVQILGVDLDEDGTVDLLDADGNGVLDQAIEVLTSRFPNYFRVVAVDPEGQPVTFQLVNAPSEAKLIDEIGTVQWYPGADVRGTSGALTVRISDGTDSVDLVIPVVFR